VIRDNAYDCNNQQSVGFDLRARQERMMRALLEYCDLGWNDQCLRFYANNRAVVTLSYNQVRKPMYSNSVGKWQKYQLYLAPLLEALDVISDYADILGQVSQLFSTRHTGKVAGPA